MKGNKTTVYCYESLMHRHQKISLKSSIHLHPVNHPTSQQGNYQKSHYSNLLLQKKWSKWSPPRDQLHWKTFILSQQNKIMIRKGGSAANQVSLCKVKNLLNKNKIRVAEAVENCLHGYTTILQKVQSAAQNMTWML